LTGVHFKIGYIAGRRLIHRKNGVSKKLYISNRKMFVSEGKICSAAYLIVLLPLISALNNFYIWVSHFALDFNTFS